MNDAYHTAGDAPRQLHVLSPIRIQTGGNHHPILCEMGDDGGHRGLWLVKPALVLSRSTDRGAFGVLAELAGAEVCAWAGLRTPAIGLTRIPEQLDERTLPATLAPEEREEIIQVFRVNRGRLAFCCGFLGGAVDLRPAHLKGGSARTQADAVALVLVDAYLRHDDRRVENPNALWHRGRLVAVDHGSAFAGLLRAGTTGDDLARQTRLHSASFPDHVALAAALAAEDAVWEAAAARLVAPGGPEVAALAGRWPEELDHDDQNGQRALRLRLARFLEERGRHARELAESLRGLRPRKP